MTRLEVRVDVIVLIFLVCPILFSDIMKWIFYILSILIFLFLLYKAYRYSIQLKKSRAINRKHSGRSRKHRIKDSTRSGVKGKVKTKLPICSQQRYSYCRKQIELSCSGIHHINVRDHLSFPQIAIT